EERIDKSDLGKLISIMYYTGTTLSEGINIQLRRYKKYGSEQMKEEVATFLDRIIEEYDIGSTRKEVDGELWSINLEDKELRDYVRGLILSEDSKLYVDKVLNVAQGNKDFRDGLYYMFKKEINEDIMFNPKLQDTEEIKMYKLRMVS